MRLTSQLTSQLSFFGDTYLSFGISITSSLNSFEAFCDDFF